MQAMETSTMHTSVKKMWKLDGCRIHMSINIQNVKLSIN